MQDPERSSRRRQFQAVLAKRLTSFFAIDFAYRISRRPWKLVGLVAIKLETLPMNLELTGW